MNESTILKEYLLVFPDEHERQQKLIEFLSNYKDNDATDWNNFDGHIVASGFVYSIKENKFLVLYHKDLKMYIYPGGHVDSSDDSILSAAKREVYEETGLVNLNILSFTNNKFIPIDIDTHYIDYNERLNLPKHLHFDFRFLFTIDHIEDVCIDTLESENYKWIDIDELRTILNNDLVLKKIEKLL